MIVISQDNAIRSSAHFGTSKPSRRRSCASIGWEHCAKRATGEIENFSCKFPAVSDVNNAILAVSSCTSTTCQRCPSATSIHASTHATKRSAHFCTSIPSRRSKIVPGTIEASVGTGQIAVIDMWDEFCAKIIWPASVPMVRAVNTCIHALSYRQRPTSTRTHQSERQPVTIAVNSAIKHRSVPNWRQNSARHSKRSTSRNIDKFNLWNNRILNTIIIWRRNCASRRIKRTMAMVKWWKVHHSIEVCHRLVQECICHRLDLAAFLACHRLAFTIHIMAVVLVATFRITISRDSPSSHENSRRSLASSAVQRAIMRTVVTRFSTATLDRTVGSNQTKIVHGGNFALYYKLHILHLQHFRV